MAQWEYRVIESNADSLSSYELNREGNNEWELVAAIPIVEIEDIDIYEGTGRGGEGRTKRIKCIFKRPV